MHKKIWINLTEGFTLYLGSEDSIDRNKTPKSRCRLHDRVREWRMSTEGKSGDVNSDHESSHPEVNNTSNLIGMNVNSAK